MSTRREYAIGVVAQMLPVAARHNAEAIIDRLNDEGLLSLGYGKKDVDRVVETFKETFGTSSVSKYDRWAAERLVKPGGPGVESVVVIIRLLGQLRDEPYTPVINNISELDKKWVSVMNFLRKQKGDEEIPL